MRGDRPRRLVLRFSICGIPGRRGLRRNFSGEPGERRSLRIDEGSDACVRACIRGRVLAVGLEADIFIFVAHGVSHCSASQVVRPKGALQERGANEGSRLLRKHR